MYAVIESSGKQYRVSLGDTIKIARRDDLEPESSIDFGNVLLLSDGEDNINIGAPHLDGVKVVGKIIEHGREKKIEIIKFRRRKHHMKRQGHRQDYTAVKIISIDDKTLEKTAKKETAKKETKAE